MAELEKARRLLETFKGLPRSGYVLLNADGEVVEINPKASKIVGVESYQVEGQRWQVVFPETRLGEVLNRGEVLVVRYTTTSDVLEVEYLPVKEREELSAVILLVRSLGEEVISLQASQKTNLLSGVNRISTQAEDNSAFAGIIGKSPSVNGLKKFGERVARGDATVLLQGESGTGKELFARAIHQAGPRRGEAFVELNCAAIPDNLLESELFGYEEGAFTGALKGGKAGKFEQANGGTIFLDEIGDMPLSMQAKVLRVLQQKSFQRIGGSREIRVDVRVIAATNRNLKELLSEGKFRLDLYYRLAVIKMKIPPLRERGSDILLLARLIMKKLNLQYNLKLEDLDSEVEGLFLSHSWPGNVRELKNVLEFAANMVDSAENILQRKHLAEDFLTEIGESKSPLTLEAVMAEAEKRALIKALELSCGNKQEAARILGIHRSGLYQKLKKHELECNAEQPISV